MDRVRPAMVAGMFYSASKHGLLDQIKQSFTNESGPGNIPTISSIKKNLIGVIVPHAGYFYSGSIAAHSYKAIADAGFADVFIILGPNHRGVGSGIAAYPKGSWKTPLGETSIDDQFIQNLSGGIIDIDETSHNMQENSIEVQLPFLQFMGEKHDFSIVPIAMSMQDLETSVDVSNQLVQTIKKDNRRIMIIASSDFSHEGLAYGRSPPSNIATNEFVKQQDQNVIDKILNFDPEGLIHQIYEKQISMCGYGPVATLLHASKQLDASKVELLKYGSSYDVSRDNSACVGYAAFSIS
jgi:AmmeMemoRadiSam system protein B